jgi:deoxyribonuclease-4
MKLGFHISISGGFKNVIPRARACGCSTIQIFSRNPRSWKYKPLNKQDIELFKKKTKSENISPVFIHMPYLANLASSKSDLSKRSVDSLIEDLERAEITGAQFLILHIGSSHDKNRGIKQMAIGINIALNRKKNNVILLLENTAGCGNELGYKFDQIKQIIDQVSEKERIGVVLDTAHAFEAGYDLKTQKGVESTIDEFNNLIGLNKLYLIHLNDSKTKLGSHSDRHWHIGKGEIGNGMRYILNHPLLKEKPFIMETPRESIKDDLMNLRRVKELLNKK